MRFTLLVFFVLLPFFMKAKVSFAAADTEQLQFRDITHIVSVDLFESIKTFVLNKGDREAYSSMYNDNPHFTFNEFELYLNPDIGQLNSDCDTSKSDFNEIVIRDIYANPQYYFIRIVRKGDIANEQIITYEGTSEEKVYLRNSNDHDDMDSMVNYVSQYVEIIKKEVTTNIVLLPTDMEDYELKVQSEFNWYDSQSQLQQGVQQEWKENGRNQYLYVKYYEYKSEFDAIEETSKLSRSFAGIYVFGSPGGEPTGNLSWTSTDRTAVIFQKWNIGVHITEPFEEPVSAGKTINDVSGKILTKINDSISTEYKVKDTLLRKEQISSADFEIVVGSSEDTLLKHGFSEYKIEDSKWVLNEDSLVLGMRKQWFAEKSFFSIDIAEFSDNDAAQKAAELNSTVKRTPLSILGDSESIKKAVEEWSLNWYVNDSIKYISVSSWFGNYAIQFYYFDEESINIDFFTHVLLNFINTGIIIKNNDDDVFKVYPNPTNNFVTISISTGKADRYQLRLTDIQGRVVLLKEDEITGSYRLDLPATKPGIYIIELKNETTAVSKLIILQ